MCYGLTLGSDVGEVVVDTPAWCRVDGVDPFDPSLIRLTTYSDKRASYAVARFIRSPKMREGLTTAQYVEQLAALKEKVKCSLLVQEGGTLRAPAGLARRLAEGLRLPLRLEVERPAAAPFPWHQIPDKVLRDYQVQAVDLMSAAGHAAVALPPGTGKTLCILHLVQRTGLSATVCSPSTAIVEQTYEELRAALGPDVVGAYGGDLGRDLQRPVTVATTQSLLRVKGAAEAFFRAKAMFCGDEAHLLPADAMRRICFDLFGRAVYRYFLSGTMDRHDGLQPMLDGIIGDLVLEMDVPEAVERRALVQMRTRMLRIAHGEPPRGSDPIRATQQVLLHSRPIHAMVGGLAAALAKAGRPVLILVKELDQLALLLPHLLGLGVYFAHGCGDKDELQKARVPERFWRADTMRIVADFNAMRFPVLVGTAAIGTGVDVRATGAAFYLRGGSAENDIRQYAGRCMRLHAESGKTDVWNFDVDVTDGGIVHRHALEREKIWKRIWRDVTTVEAG